MSKNLKRNIQQLFRVDQGELDLIQKKMKCAGIGNKNLYYRKMVLDGYIVRLDLSDIREMTRLLSNVTNSMNQIAKRVNSNGNIYKNDIIKIQENYEYLWNQSREILQKLANIPR